MIHQTGPVNHAGELREVVCPTKFDDVSDYFVHLHFFRFFELETLVRKADGTFLQQS